MKREGFLASIGALFGSSVIPFKAPKKLGRVISVTAADSIHVTYTIALMGSARCGPMRPPIRIISQTDFQKVFGHAS